MCADAFLREADGVDKRLELRETQRVEVQAACYLIDHALVLGTVGASVGLEVLGVVALEFLDDATCDELQVALARAVVDEGTAVNERRTTYSHVNLLGSEVVKHLRVVPQLRSSHDAVVAEEDAFAFEDVPVGDEFHLGDKVSHLLIAGREGARPSGRVLAYGTHIGAAVPLGVADSHAHTAVWNAASAIHLSLVL